jgi:adenosylcobinamide kinase/adenosylcobinamide-phosphate guanylyltransferase
MNSYKILLVTGGSRSGKTAYSLQRAMEHENRVYIATAEPFDDEMTDRISRHRKERGENFQTLEEPLELADAINRIPSGTDVALIDCLTVWMGNLMHKRGEQDFPRTEITSFLQALENPPCNIIIVTNELGSGIVPLETMTRTYRDHAGWLNQDVARRADEVVLVACGLPLTLKGKQ